MSGNSEYDEVDKKFKTKNYNFHELKVVFSFSLERDMTQHEELINLQKKDKKSPGM